MLWNIVLTAAYWHCLWYGSNFGHAGVAAVLYALLCQVMAGTGNLAVLRLIRQLHGRLQSSEINYGSHMAVHMALGFLFLGGGRYVH